jgi:hypothetical protein
VSEPVVSYELRPGTTPESELSTLAGVYKFVLDRHAKKKAAPESRPEQPGKESDELRAKTSIPQG